MFGIAKNAGAPSNTQIFTPTTGVNGQGYQIWRKPPNASMVHFFMLSGGGGGGGGTVSGVASGGAGGACSNITRFFCLASILPNELYIQVGVGGQGGASGVNGTAGTNSFILTSPRTAVLPNIILYSGVNAPGGGTRGIASGANTGGSVPTVPVVQPFNQNGKWSTTVGLVAPSGTANVSDAPVTAWASIPLSPGAGGAGAGALRAGAAVSATAITDLGTAGYYNTTIAAGGGSSTSNVHGNAGRKSITPFLNSGGSGGGNAVTLAGNGGDGGWGCGGGGGGSCTSGSLGGRGGNGGDGIVIINWI